MRVIALAMMLGCCCGSQTWADDASQPVVQVKKLKTRSDCSDKCSKAQAACEEKLTIASSADEWQKCADDYDACIKDCE